MKENNRNYFLLAAAISLTSLPLGSSLTRAALSPTTLPNQDSNVQPSTWITRLHTSQLIATQPIGQLILQNLIRTKSH